jgi:hypothetical protein
MVNLKVLFILKLRTHGSNPYWHGHSSGLYTSVLFLHKMLLESNIESEIVEVTDNNSIDREVSRFKPTFCFIEALWVVPEKFEILHRLHPKVKWIIRIHSNIPFLALEGISMDWLMNYTKYENVFIACNNIESYKSMSYIIREKYGSTKKILYLPNHYDIQEIKTPKTIPSRHIHIGCFGAIRPLKNHLIQAIAAIRFADQINKKLKFHINMGRVEGYNAHSILKNLRMLFTNVEHHELVEHLWLDRKDFLNLIDEMDMGLQVSMSETFNIVSADFINKMKPVVGSKDISWLAKECFAEPTIEKDIFEKMLYVYDNKRNVKICKQNLYKFCLQTQIIWLKFIIKNYNK